MRLILLSALQAILTVSGMGLLTMALGGREVGVKSILSGFITPAGLAGIVLLLASFAVTSIIFSFAKLSIFVPLNTAMVFVLTLIFASVFNNEPISAPLIVGMVLIASGIVVISYYRTAL